MFEKPMSVIGIIEIESFLSGGKMGEKFHIRLSTIVSFTIAILTMFSGLLGWQMGNISGMASSEYSRAQRAELNRQKITSTNTLKAYEDYRAFLVYKNYFEQYKLVSTQLDKAHRAEPIDDKLVTQLTTRKDELESLYLSNLKLFPNQFINRDGTYNIQEEMGQLNAAEIRKFDTNPNAFKERGAIYDSQVSCMQVALIILAVSLFFFAIVSTVEGLNKFTLLGFIVVGYVAAATGVSMGIINWKPSLENQPIPTNVAEETIPVMVTTATKQQTATFLPPTATILPTETMTPVLVTATVTPDLNVPPPLAPSIDKWDFVCSNSKKTMGINLLWSDVAANEIGYRIIRNGEVVAELPAGANAFTDSIPLVKGEKMIYQIEVFNSGGSSFSLEYSFTC